MCLILYGSIHMWEAVLYVKSKPPAYSPELAECILKHSYMKFKPLKIKVVGNLCALTRWSVHEHVNTVFAPMCFSQIYLCKSKYAGEWKFSEGAYWYLLCLCKGTGWWVWGGAQGPPTQK